MASTEEKRTRLKQSRGWLLVKQRRQQRAWIYIAVVVAVAVLGPILTGYLLPFSKVLLSLRNNATSDADVVIYLDGDLEYVDTVPALYQVTYLFKVVGGRHTTAISVYYPSSNESASDGIDWSQTFSVGIYGSEQLVVNIDEFY